MSLKAKINITICLIFLLSLALFFFLIRPCLIQAVKNGENLMEMKKNTAISEIQIKALQDFKPRYEQEIKPMVQESEKLFIDLKNPVAFISLTEDLAIKNGLNIDISSAQIFTAENTGEVWPSLNFKISLNGPFSEILRFIEKMSNIPYLIEIHNLNIEKTSQIQNKNQTAQDAIVSASLQSQASFNLKVYAK